MTKNDMQTKSVATWQSIQRVKRERYFSQFKRRVNVGLSFFMWTEARLQMNADVALTCLNNFIR